MNAWTIILDIVLILISIVLIIAVLLQQGQRQGLGAIAGGAETFFGKNKAKSYEAKMAKITKIGAAIFIVAAIAATIVAARTAPADTTDAAGDTTYTAEELEQITTATASRITPLRSTPTRLRWTRPRPTKPRMTPPKRLPPRRRLRPRKFPQRT